LQSFSFPYVKEKKKDFHCNRGYGVCLLPELLLKKSSQSARNRIL